MQISTLDGVTVLSRPSSGRLTASLMFAAGVAHATFRTHNLPHLLEHMIAGSLPQTRLEANATTGSDRMTFDVRGTPEEVRTHLEGICAAIRDLPLERRVHEARVVTAEGGSVVHPGAADSASTRYGLLGPGLVQVDMVPADQITDEELTAFAAEHLVAGNAVLTLTGEIPAGLRLDLPAGVPVRIPEPWRMPETVPGFFRQEVPQVIATVEVPDEHPATLMLRVWRDRSLDRLRHELGITYSVEMIGTSAGAGRAVYGLTADGADGDVVTIAEGLVAVLRDLARSGATDQECAEDLASFDEYLDDPDSATDLLEQQAVRVLTGREARAPEESRAALAAVGPEGVREAAREALRTLLVAAPEDAWGTHGAPAGLTDRTEVERGGSEEVEGRTFAKKLLRPGPRNTRLRIGETGVSMRSGDMSLSLPWAEVVGVDTADGARVVIGREITTLSFAARDFKDGDVAARMIDERLAGLLFDSDGVG